MVNLAPEKQDRVNGACLIEFEMENNYDYDRKNAAGNAVY